MTPASSVRPLTFVLLMSSATARADTEAFEPVAIEYEATLTCVDRSAFLDKIRKRTTRFRETKDGARRFIVRIGSEGGRFGGHLEIDTRGIRTHGSTVEGRTCEEVVDALALSTALAIDPSAPPRPRPPQPPAPAPAPQPEPERAPPVPPPPTPQASPAWHGEIGAELVAASGVAPGLTPAGALFVGLAHRGGATFRLGAIRGLAKEVPTDIGTATFQWTAARAVACPWGWAPVARIRLLPCGVAEGGVLTASGKDIAQPETKPRPWVAAGLSARLAFGLGRLVMLEFGGEAVFPFWRSDFFFVAPNETQVHEVPSITARAAVGIVLGFE